MKNNQPKSPAKGEKLKTGRPSLYSIEVCQKICLLISTSSHGLNKICKDNDDLPEIATVYNWLNDESKKAFLDMYVRAREEQADYLADEILEIADDSKNDTITKVGQGGKEYEAENTEWVNRSKLRVESRKWIAAKLKPRKYGDKIDLTTNGDKISTSLDKLSAEEIKVLMTLQNKATLKSE